MTHRENVESRPVPPAGGDWAVRHLAHEMNSRLDGALRTLRAARRDGGDEGRFAERLATIEETLVGMTQAVERTLRSTHALSVGAVFDSGRELGESLRGLVRTFGDLADQAGVAVRIECDRDASILPIGPLEPLLANAIRNAIEACASIPEAESPTVTVALRRRGARLLIDVVDNGPGLGGCDGGGTEKPTGHGFGLEVARRIAASLGGTIELSNIPFGRGAIFRAEVSVAPLSAREAA